MHVYNYAMSNATLIVNGSIHQGDRRFSDVSRGRQCAFMSLSALLCANSSDVSQWTAHTVNKVLTAEDDMYLKAFQEKTIPDTETISLAYLPDRIRWAAIITLDPYTSNRPSSEAQNQSPTRVTNNELPIVVEPLVVQKQSEQLPLVAQKRSEQSPLVAQKQNEQSPLVAQKQNEQSSLVAQKQNEQSPLVAQKQNEQSSLVAQKRNEQSSLVAQKQSEQSTLVAQKRNEQSSLVAQKQNGQSPSVEMSKHTANSTLWAINYKDFYQGRVARGEHENVALYLSLHSALINTFSNDNYAFIILQGCVMALIKHFDDCIYVFDSHSRNYYGMPEPNGTAVVMKCNNITMLEQYLCFLSLELSSELFEIVPVQFHCDAHHSQSVVLSCENPLKRKRHDEIPSSQSISLSDHENPLKQKRHNETHSSQTLSDYENPLK